MGSGNCSECKCRKGPEENEIQFTENHFEVNTSLQDEMSHKSGGGPRNKINNMVHAHIPSELFQDDFIDFNSKRGNYSLSPRERNTSRDSLEKIECEFQHIGHSNSKAKCKDIKIDPINDIEINDRNQHKETVSLSINVINDDINPQLFKINDQQQNPQVTKSEEGNKKNPLDNGKVAAAKSILQEEKCENIDFGIPNASELTFEQQKLLFDIQKNLNQFYPPQAKELKTLNSKLRKIPLTSIIPEYKLLSCLPHDELIFNGDLKKLVNYEVNAHKPQLYSSRFCTLTKSAFRYYKSKEQYLTMNKPQCEVPLNQITKLSFIKTKKTSKKIDHILICNKQGFTKDKRDIANSKLFEVYEQNAYENNESLLIFTCEIEDFLFKWYLLLDFFLSELSQ